MELCRYPGQEVSGTLVAVQKAQEVADPGPCVLGRPTTETELIDEVRKQHGVALLSARLRDGSGCVTVVGLTEHGRWPRASGNETRGEKRRGTRLCTPFVPVCGIMDGDFLRLPLHHVESCRGGRLLPCRSTSQPLATSFACQVDPAI